MKLRPHHLMCTQGYSGKGYNEGFIAQMNYITDILKNNETVSIELVFGADDICPFCPRLSSGGLCADNEKVMGIDGKMIYYFGLEEREYIYGEILQEIKDKITDEIMDDICGTCEWYGISACKKKMTGKR